MAPSKKNADKRCPQCNGQIDYFGSCKKCGREWSEALEEGEHAFGLPEGDQYDSVVKQIGEHKPRKSRFTKSKAALQGKEFVTFAPPIPTKFAEWMIDPSNDGETEIIRKRSLMRLDSRKLYNAMGLSVRAHDQLKGTMLWLTRLWEFLGDDERKALAPTVELLKQAYAGIRAMSESKVKEAAQMEIVLEKAHSAARKARLRIMEEEKRAALRKQAANPIPLEGEDTEGFSTPELVGLPPDALLEIAKERLANIDVEKAKKRKRPNPFKDPTEEIEESE
jgi:hypothetical protein